MRNVWRKQMVFPLTNGLPLQSLKKIGAVETTATFLAKKAGSAKPSDMLIFIENSGSEHPQEADSIQKN